MVLSKEEKSGYENDFATVDLLLSTDFETRGVDAFALSLIKAEKQMRRVFTFLIFQNSCYDLSHFSRLRETLAANRQIYFAGFINGINLILPRELKELYGDSYEADITDILEFSKDRNKIFHGQITANGLSREALVLRVNHIKGWCKLLAKQLSLEIGYDGFGNSYQKSKLALNLKNVDKFDTIEKYGAFLKEHLQR